MKLYARDMLEVIIGILAVAGIIVLIIRIRRSKR